MEFNNLIQYIKSLFIINLDAAKDEFKDYWYSWSTIGGDNYEGVIIEIDNGTYHVLCIDGVERAI